MLKSDYQKLISQIRQHDTAYALGKPTITDSEYDQLYFKLQTYEQLHPTDIDPMSPTQKITDITTKKQKITHPYPMLSLAKANDLTTVEKFLNKFTTDHSDPTQFSTDDFMIQLKEDGLTIVMYFNWFDKPFVASTRGQGNEGVDVSHKFTKFAHQLPHQKAIIRGEALLTNAQFEALNEHGEYANPRNAASGIINDDDSDASVLTFVAYNIENAEDFGFTTEGEMLEQLANWGFTTPSLQQTFPNSEDGHHNLTEFIKTFEDTKQREAIDHDIDGLVIKPNYIKNRRQLGFTSHHPRNQLAYKFASPDAISILRDVIWQTGPSGRLTPVAVFDPVEILGVTIEKASLASLNNIKSRDLMLNDRILIRRANDVIPQIVKSFPEYRNGQEQEIMPPVNSVIKGAYVYGLNNQTDTDLQKWRRFVSKDGLNLENVSLSLIKQLADEGLLELNDFSSLWQHLDDIAHLTGKSGKPLKRMQDLAKQLSHVTIPLSSFIYALGIEGVAKNSSKKLAEYFVTVENLTHLTPITPVSNWEINLPESVFEHLTKTLSQMQTLLNVITVTDQKQTSMDNLPLADQVYVITGKSTEISRADLTAKLETLGAEIKSTVSKTTTAVINLSDKMDSTKAKKALTLGVPLLTWDQTKTLLEKIT